MRFRQFDSGPQGLSLSGEQSHIGSSDGSITIRTAVVHLFTWSEKKKKPTTKKVCKKITNKENGTKPYFLIVVAKFLAFENAQMCCCLCVTKR